MVICHKIICVVHLLWAASLKLCKDVHLLSNVLAMKLCTLGCWVNKNELILIWVAEFSDCTAAHSNVRLLSGGCWSSLAPDTAMSYKSYGFHTKGSSAGEVLSSPSSSKSTTGSNYKQHIYSTLHMQTIPMYTYQCIDYRCMYKTPL